MARKDVSVKMDGKDVKIYVDTPTADVVARADRYKAKIWTECIEDGIKTREELEDLLEKRGSWSKAHKEKETMIIKKIQDLEKSLYLGDGRDKEISDGVNIAITMRRLRSDLRNLISEKINLEQNCAENLSDNARFDFLVANCTFYENGQTVYNGIQDYNKKAANEIAFAAASALAEMMYGYDTTSDENLPENKWLKHFDLINEKGSLVDETGGLVDLDGRRINEFGHFINEDGKRIDINGNLLDENGNYLITAKYNVKKATPVKKRQAKKTTRSKKPATES